MEIVWLLVSLVILYFGAEGLVSGASSLAKRIGISPLVIGLTIVSIGTSAPELVVSVKAAMNGQSALSIGNVLGSNFFNIGIILGLSALIYPLAVKRQLLKLDVPVMVMVSVLFFLLFLDSRISGIEALVFILLFVSYTGYLLISSKKKTHEAKDRGEEDEIRLSKHWMLDVLFIGVGLAGLVYGSDLLVENAVIIAGRLGMSEAMIGLTIVAAGTSMPELATSVVAAIKKRADIAIGNVVGSNIFNILLILGVAGLIQPISAPDINYVDSLFVIGISLLLWIFMKQGTRITRWQGAAFILFYLVYFSIKLTTM
ncbi:K+-dependent Na+/Ca+ exchanger related-protein [Proteiniphilum saccharofermentans]|uniref:K+-dependent Na+/Ca+ exchanger related-protein n=1 Tax=Proteiniphilum saccharofermentans TaxID=1642647 RepID=A0A1R3SU24_9BACT|nr:calcium/sodium antiporter [Proteiniphilum saccharofermentans]SCD19823.1 K+-dependent Na+/Ca+ exchanger related-protein [Proteiniphilum saccharofermentans]